MRRSQHHAAKENDPRCPIAGQESELIGPGPPFCCSAVAQHSKRCSGMEKSHIHAGVVTLLSNFGIVPWLRTRQTATGDGRTFRSTPMFAQLSWHYHGHQASATDASVHHPSAVRNWLQLLDILEAKRRGATESCVRWDGKLGDSWVLFCTR